MSQVPKENLTTIPLPAIIAVFLIAALVGAVYGASWYSVLGVASPAIMGAMLVFEEKREQST